MCWDGLTTGEKIKELFQRKSVQLSPFPPIFIPLFLDFGGEGNREYICPSESLSPLLFVAQICQVEKQGPGLWLHQNPWPDPDPCRDLTLTMWTTFPPHSCSFQEQLQCWGRFLELFWVSGAAQQVPGSCLVSLHVTQSAVPPSPAPFPAPSDNSSRQWFPPPALPVPFYCSSTLGMCCEQGWPSHWSCLFNLWLLPSGNIRQGSAAMNSEVSHSQTLTPRSKRKNYLSNAKNQWQLTFQCFAELVFWGDNYWELFGF